MQASKRASPGLVIDFVYMVAVNEPGGCIARGPWKRYTFPTRTTNGFQAQSIIVDVSDSMLAPGRKITCN